MCECVYILCVVGNGVKRVSIIPAGGPYFLISANLGPEFGGATGIIFYLAHTLSVSLFVLGAIELLVVRFMSLLST